MNEVAIDPIEQLIAIEDIKILKARRDRALDTKDWVTYEALHAPDHQSRTDGFPSWNLTETIENVRALLQHVDTAHHSHTPEITFSSPTHAEAIWGMEDMLYWNQGEEEHWLHGCGYYFETYEKRDGRWLFTSRRVRRNHLRSSPGAAPGSDLVTPRRRPEGGAFQ